MGLESSWLQTVLVRTINFYEPDTVFLLRWLSLSWIRNLAGQTPPLRFRPVFPRTAPGPGQGAEHFEFIKEFVLLDNSALEAFLKEQVNFQKKDL